MCDKSPGSPAAERDPDASPCQVAGEPCKGARAPRCVRWGSRRSCSRTASAGLGSLVLHESDARESVSQWPGGCPSIRTRTVSARSGERGPEPPRSRPGREHDGGLRPPCRKLRGKAVAQRSSVTGLGGDDGIGTIAAHGEGGRRARRSHRHDRHCTAELRLDRPASASTKARRSRPTSSPRARRSRSAAAPSLTMRAASFSRRPSRAATRSCNDGWSSSRRASDSRVRRTSTASNATRVVTARRSPGTSTDSPKISPGP